MPPALAQDKIFANRKCGEVSYTVVVQPMGFEIQTLLWDLMSTMVVDRAGRQGADAQLGRVRDAVIYNGIKKLTVEDKDISLDDRYSLRRVPKYADRTFRRKFPEDLLRHIVEVNDFLGFEEPFDMVFRPYLPEELRDQPDPTESDEDTPTAEQVTATTSRAEDTEPQAQPEEAKKQQQQSNKLAVT